MEQRPTDLVSFREAGALVERSASTIRGWVARHGLQEWRDMAAPDAAALVSKAAVIEIGQREKASTMSLLKGVPQPTMSGPKPDDLITFRDASALIGHCDATLRRWRDRNGLQDWRDTSNPSSASLVSRADVLAMADASDTRKSRYDIAMTANRAGKKKAVKSGTAKVVHVIDDDTLRAMLRGAYEAGRYGLASSEVTEEIINDNRPRFMQSRTKTR